MNFDDTILIEYALGNLDKEESFQVNAALSTSAELRKKLDEIQESLGIMAFAETPIRPTNRLKDRILASTSPTNHFEGFTERFAELFDLGEKEIRRLFSKIDNPNLDDWTSSPVLPGVGILEFPGGVRTASATCGLITVKPGTLFPRHRHQGEEWVLVLQGRARESDGRILNPGDLMISETGSEHAFKTLGSEPYVFAVLLKADNKWLIGQSLLDRIFEKSRFPLEKD